MRRTSLGPLQWILPGLLLLAVVCCWAAGLFAPLQTQLEDTLYQHPGGPDSRIFVIGIDEYTLTELGDFGAWSREATAELVEMLTRDAQTAPAVIGLDIGFYGTRDPLIDARLAEACAKAGNVVTAGALTMGTVLETGADGTPRAARRPILVETPYPALAAASQWGHTNIDLDADGVFRRSRQTIEFEGRDYESFADVILRAYTGQGADITPDADGQWRIPFSAKPYAYYGAPGAGASFVRVLRGEIPVSLFTDSIVLIGAYAHGMQDDYYTPVSRQTKMYGVEIHANILQAMLGGRQLREVPAALSALVCAALWVASLLFLWRFAPGISVPLVMLLGGGYALAAWQLSRGGWMLPLLPPLTGMALLLVCSVAMQFLHMWRERRRLVSDFSRYLPREIATQVAEKGHEALHLGGVRRPIAVLFVDIRGFTPLSERLDPERLVALLNEFLALTTDCIFANNGTVDKFIGDATMALFNAPQSVESYTHRAVQAALAMQQRGRALCETLQTQGFDGIGFGLGIHCGDAVVGNIGTAARMEYTAIGDTVNTAARLESQAAAGEILITEAMHESIRNEYVCTYLDTRALKGKAAPVPLWRVEGMLPERADEEAQP